jgi:hypothetical protein
MAATDEHYRAAELAKLWGISPAAVRERFKFEEGVAFLGQHGSAEKRAYTTMLIPVPVGRGGGSTRLCSYLLFHHRRVLPTLLCFRNLPSAQRRGGV